MIRTSAMLFACTLVLVTGCAKKPEARDIAQVSTTAGTLGSVRVDNELVKMCNVTFGNADRAPKFDYDEAALLPQDRDVLEQVAKCVTTGPLKGRKLALVGRADPRGETEYNMVLGDTRADAVHVYTVASAWAPPRCRRRPAVSSMPRGRTTRAGSATAASTSHSSRPVLRTA